MKIIKKMKRINNKAAVKQVFTFLMVAILIGLIFLFGIRSLSGINKDANQAELAIFQKDIINYVNKHTTYHTAKTEIMRIPGDYTQLCFVDKRINTYPTTNNNLFNSMALDDENNNIFLLKGNTESKPLGYADKIVVENPARFVCIKPIDSKLRIKFLGLGNATKIVDPLNP
jgi:hypothetical protein